MKRNRVSPHFLLWKSFGDISFDLSIRNQYASIILCIVYNLMQNFKEEIKKNNPQNSYLSPWKTKKRKCQPTTWFQTEWAINCIQHSKIGRPPVIGKGNWGRSANFEEVAINKVISDARVKFQSIPNLLLWHWSMSTT